MMVINYYENAYIEIEIIIAESMGKSNVVQARLEENIKILQEYQNLTEMQ